MFPEHSWSPLKKRKCLHKRKMAAANRQWVSLASQGTTLGVASVTEKGRRKGCETQSPYILEREKGAGGGGALWGGKHCPVVVLDRPTLGRGFRNLCHQHLLRWVLCDKDSKSMTKGQRKKRCVGGIQGDVCLKQHGIQLEILSCRKLYVKLSHTGQFKGHRVST